MQSFTFDSIIDKEGKLKFQAGVFYTENTTILYRIDSIDGLRKKYMVPDEIKTAITVSGYDGFFLSKSKI